MKPTYALSLYNSILGGGTPLDLTNRLIGWRRTIRRMGGFWLGTASYNLETGSESDMVDWYLNRLGQRLVEYSGGVTWEGFLAKAELTYEGETYIRSLFDLSNRLQVKYTRIGPNLFTNGDVETDPDIGAADTWQAFGTPAERVWIPDGFPDWAVRGTHSLYCDADNEQDGVIINSDITIEAETPYQIFVTINVVAERWLVKVYRDTGGGTPGALIARGKTPRSGTGEFVVQVDIPDTNPYTNIMVTIEGKMPDGGPAAQGYFDNAILQLAPSASETQWYSDTDSIAQYGQHDEILLEAQMTLEAAESKAQRKLAERAWPRSLPPESIGGGSFTGATGLKLTFAGYVWTLNWKYARITGQTDASTQIANIVGESDFVTAGAITTNTLQFLMASTRQIMAWDAIEEIIYASDANYTDYEGGVYAGRLFHYGPASTDIQYYYQGGRLYDADMAPALPWAARPGIVHLSDMPAGPVSATGNVADDPRNVRYDQVEFVAPDRVTFSQTEEY